MSDGARWPWYPVTAAIYVGLVLVAETGVANAAGIDLAQSAGAGLLLAIGGTAAARIGGADRSHAALVGLLAVLWGGTFAMADFFVGDLVGAPLPPAASAVGWTLLLGGGAVWLVRRARRGAPPLASLARGLDVAMLVLCLLQGVRFGQQVASERASRRAALAAASQARPRVPDARRADRPDIYVIILDKYSSGRWLVRSYGHDNRPFEDSLRALGFVVPSHARANYIHTELALPTMFDWRYVHRDADPGIRPDTQLRRHFLASRAWRVARDHGYRIAFFPTTFGLTASLPEADLVMKPAETVVASRSSSWTANSPVPALRGVLCGWLRCGGASTFPYPVEDATAVRAKFAQLETLADSAGPIFGVLHVLAPHEPYVYDDRCQPQPPQWPVSDQGGADSLVRVLYVRNVRCTNALVLATVTRLLRRPGPPPVIVLQSDHGHGRITVNPLRGFSVPLAALPDDRVQERTSVFAAYRFPGARQVMRDSITPINVLPMVFDAVLGTQLPRHEDRTYWSAYERLFEVVPVPER